MTSTDIRHSKEGVVLLIQDLLNRGIEQFSVAPNTGGIGYVVSWQHTAPGLSA